jgi:shikimate dehydrogenase
MFRFGLIRAEGPPSRSPELYRTLWAGHSLESALHYETLDLDPRADWTEWLRAAHNEGWSGFNATIPHKIDVFNSIADRSPAAHAIGATNCIVRTPKGWQCHNTDADGFWEGWTSHWNGHSPRHNRAWVLGNGGAARAIAYALVSRNVDVLCFARAPRTDFLGLVQLPFAATADFSAPDLIVNATSLGHGSQSHLSPPIVWPDLHGAWAIDAVYGPQPTPFQIQASQKGAHVLDGMPMLRMQAKKAWEYWSGMLNIPDF